MSSANNSDMEYSDNDCEYDDYYNSGEDCDVERLDPTKSDPEYFEYDCLTVEEVEKLLNESVEKLSMIINVTPSLAKVLLLENQWMLGVVVDKFRQNSSALLVETRINPPPPPKKLETGNMEKSENNSGNGNVKGGGSPHSGGSPLIASNSNKSCASSTSTSTSPSSSSSLPSSGAATTTTIATVATATTIEMTSNNIHDDDNESNTNSPNNNNNNNNQPSSSSSSSTTTTNSNSASPPYRSQTCPVCTMVQLNDKFFSLVCGHSFCKECWSMYFETQIFQGISIQIGCMAQMCNVRVPEILVLTLVTRPVLREKYQQFAFRDYVKTHPKLRFCPGANCQIIIHSNDLAPKRAVCNRCSASFCFKCGVDYHAPADCQTIRKWLTKCADDSETANYISANTKDCPKCNICIEKNGGCNHMRCFNCQWDFCWMCLGNWKTHGSEYYECSRYKDNPNIANESVHVQAREALKKYLHYYERWENHSKSLQLEQQTLDRLRERINEKVMKGRGTWIDWQYLFNAASLLAKCRYTLQYTYPYAYFMESGSRKDLFEYQQAQLEAEIENLSWKIERAETTDLGDLENQMDIAEKRRTTLLKDFFPINVQ